MSFDGFEIQPSYFTIERNEFIDVQVTFMPQHFGLHTQHCYLLCNNSGYETFDIIGDGVFFEKHFIQCEVIENKF